MSRSAQIKIHLDAMLRELRTHLTTWQRVKFHIRGIFRALKGV